MPLVPVRLGLRRYDLAKHGDSIRYVRYDLPLAGHPWAFPAALVGRAIHRQKPDLFWDYKKTVYGSQDTLNAFTFWDWARGWAGDHDLDMAKYDADLNNAEIKAQILAGAGHAFRTTCGPRRRTSSMA